MKIEIKVPHSAGIITSNLILSKRKSNVSGVFAVLKIEVGQGHFVEVDFNEIRAAITCLEVLDAED